MRFQSVVDPLRKSHWWWIAILCLAVAVRIVALEFRPLHNDEAVNHFFLGRIDALGYYPYSHLNYHGPLFFYLLWAVVRVLGDSEFALRMLSVISGVLIALVPMFYARLLGRAPALTAGLLLALSPSLVFFSRYAIHEPLFILCQLIFALEVFQLSRDSSRGYALAAVMAAFLVATKETFPLVFVVVLGALAASSFQQLRTLLRLRRILGGVSLAGVVIIAIYSGGFRWMGGPVELLAAIPQWIGRGTSSDVGHFKPFTYYFVEMFLKTEPTVAFGLCCSALWLVYGLRQRGSNRDALSLYFAIWAWLALLLYSFIPYKTPWLAPNIAVPALLFVGRLVGLRTSRGIELRGVLLLSAFVVTLGISSAQLLRFNYPIQIFGRTWGVPYGEQNPFSYVHTTAEVRPIAKSIVDYAKRYPTRLILIQSDGYWPLPYYLREVRSQIRYLSSPAVQFSDPAYSQFVCEPIVTPPGERFQAAPFTIYEGESAVLYQRREIPSLEPER